MSPAPATASLRVDELLARIGAPAPSPGSGAAAAVALALAAACAAKAVAVTLRHRPGDAALESSAKTLEHVVKAALDDADADSAAFEASVHSQDRKTLDDLVRETERLTPIFETLSGALREVSGRIAQNVIGDLIAADALTAAAERIQKSNAEEARRLRELRFPSG